MNQHSLQLKVYLEDTDAQGIVYHANYLKFFERARSEVLQHLGIPMQHLENKERFVVHQLILKYLQPARLGDLLEVRSSYRRVSEFRLTFLQDVFLVTESSLLTQDTKTDKQLVKATVDVVCVDSQGNLIELPDSL